MDDILFIVPLLVGFGIMALGYKLQIPKGPAMNGPALGLALVIGSLCWWLSTAILLVREGKFYFIINMMTVIIFFTGLAFFLPAPSPGAGQNRRNLPATILFGMGLILGLAHSLALAFTATWPARLLELYAALGLHGGSPPSP